MNLDNLDPRQKRMLAVAGVGVVLALIVVLSRRSAPAPAAADTAASTSAYEGDQWSAPAVPPSTYADNGAAAGAISSEISDALYDTSDALDYQSEQFEALSEGTTEGLGLVGAGLSAQAGTLTALQKRLRALERQNKKLTKAIRQDNRPGGGKGGKGGGPNKPGKGNKPPGGPQQGGPKRSNRRR